MQSENSSDLSNTTEVPMNYTPTTWLGNCFEDENNPAVLRVEDEDNDHGASSLPLGLCVTVAVSMIEDILSFFLFSRF